MKKFDQISDNWTEGNNKNLVFSEKNEKICLIYYDRCEK